MKKYMINAHVNTLDIESIQQLGKLELIAKHVVEGFITGLHKSPFHGFSVEFAEHRSYNTGESTKHIDWKLYARTDRLYVKKYEEETNLRCQILLDNSSSMYFPDKNYNKLQFSIYAIASLIHLLKKQRDATGLTVFSEKIEDSFVAKSSHAHIQLLFNQLQKNLDNGEKNKKTATAQALHSIAENIHKRSLVVIFSDMFDNMNNEDAFFEGLQHLKYKKNEVILFHVLDKKKEIEFDYKNRPYRFIDLETNEKIDLFPGEIRKDYIMQFENFRNKLKLKCNQYHIDYVEADINKGFFSVLQSYLVKRAKMF
ncbi:MAG: DUF58 domain-containing protein [Bacteroidota bacterium]|nr:DUF58 domain-containing protein [Bacteroidota bacterium]